MLGFSNLSLSPLSLFFYFTCEVVYFNYILTENLMALTQQASEI